MDCPSFLYVAHTNHPLTSYQANPTELDSSKQEIIKKRVIKEGKKIISNAITGGFYEVVPELKASLKFTINHFFSEGQFFSKEVREKQMSRFKLRLESYEKTVETFQIQTFDQATLDGMIIHPKVHFSKEEKCVIWLNGFQESFESKAIRALQYANQAAANIAIFNFRGTGASSKALECSDDFVKDTLSVIDFLVNKKKLKPENITLHGFSLSSGIAAKVALLKGPIRYINDRGYLKFSSLVKDSIDEAYGILGTSGSSLLKGAGFEINTKKLYLDKDKTKLKTLAGKTFVIFHGNDKTVKPKKAFCSLLEKQIPFHSTINLDDYHQKITEESIEKFYTEVVFSNSDKGYNLPDCVALKNKLKKEGRYSLENYKITLSLKVYEEIQKEEEKFVKPSYFEFSGQTKEEVRKNLHELDQLLEYVYTNAHTISFLIFPEVMKELVKFIHNPEKESPIETTIYTEHDSKIGF